MPLQQTAFWKHSDKRRNCTFFPQCFPLFVKGYPFNYRDFLCFDKICSKSSAAELSYEGKELNRQWLTFWTSSMQLPKFEVISPRGSLESCLTLSQSGITSATCTESTISWFPKQISCSPRRIGSTCPKLISCSPRMIASTLSWFPKLISCSPQSMGSTFSWFPKLISCSPRRIASTLSWFPTLINCSPGRKVWELLACLLNDVS